MSLTGKMKTALALWRAYRTLGGIMNATEILAAIQAIEALLPAIEKGYADVKVVVADVEKAVADVKAKIAAAKEAAKA